MVSMRTVNLGLCVIAAVLSFLASAPNALGQEESAEVEKDGAGLQTEHFSDEGRVFDALRADPLEAQFRLGYINDYHGNGFLDFVFGGDIALVSWQHESERKSSLTVRGLVGPRFQFNSDSFDLLNLDFQGGLAFGTKLKELSWEAYLYHQSSHLGDEVLDAGLRPRIDSSKEGLRFLVSREWETVRLYGGSTVNFRTDPGDYDEHVVFQGGLECRFWEEVRPLYVALDLQTRQSNGWNINTTVQFGVELGDVEKTENRHRLFVELFNGHSNMGQYFNESESYAFFGVSYNLR